MEDWVSIKNLRSKNPDLGTRKIAKLLGISRNTVKKALLSDNAPEYNRGVKKVNKHIEPFTGVIKESFLKKNLKASRILKDIRSKGYEGSQYALYAYIRKELRSVKEDINGNNPSAFKSYETKPGEQMQYDWAEYIVEIDSYSVKIYIHQTILGFSRLKFYDVSISITQGDVFEALEESFHFFGGVCDRIQVDNAKVFIDNASRDNFVWNKRFLHFCGFYGIKPTRSIPGHPWSKGKVEKPFEYLENHFIKGNKFKSFQELRDRLKTFQDEVNSLLHGGTHEITNIRFKTKEAEFLKQLPVNDLTGKIKRYVGFKEEIRRVTNDCLISYKNNKYSVPHYFAGCEVWVRTLRGVTLEIYSSKNKLIASHKLSLSKKEIIVNKEHFAGYRTNQFDSIAISVSKLRERFVNYTNIHKFIENIKVQKRINHGHHLHKIANLFEYYDDKDCILAMEECFTLNVFNANIIKGYISQTAKVKEENLNLLHIDLPTGDVKRDLGEYKL